MASIFGVVGIGGDFPAGEVVELLEGESLPEGMGCIMMWWSGMYRSKTAAMERLKADLVAGARETKGSDALIELHESGAVGPNQCPIFSETLAAKRPISTHEFASHWLARDEN